MVVSLIGPIDNNHVQRVLLVAAYAGTKIKLVPITDGIENTTEAYRLNCHPLGLVPVLKSGEGYLFEPAAMVRYVCRTEVLLPSRGPESEKVPHPQYPLPYAMYGHSLEESCEIDAWLAFASERMDLPVARLQADAGDAEARRFLFQALATLEGRLSWLREERQVLLQQSGGALTARTSFIDENLLEDNASPPVRDAQLSSVYNVAKSVRAREETDRAAKGHLEAIKRHTDNGVQDGDGSDAQHTSPITHAHVENSFATPRGSSATRHSEWPTARGTTALSARGSFGGGVGGTVIQRHDILFLVGDSLTAADIYLAMALHATYRIEALTIEAQRAAPVAYRYYKIVMTLPIAASVGKALGIILE